MVCSVCGGSGHNKRTCVIRKIQDIDERIPDHVKERIVDYLTEEITDEALLTAIEFGSEIAIPGIGIVVRVGRHAWKMFNRR